MADTSDAPAKRGTRPSSLLNRAAVRRFILDAIERDRPYLRITRVSRKAVDALEGYLREKIRRQVQGHPSIGKTFKP